MAEKAQAFNQLSAIEDKIIGLKPRAFERSKNVIQFDKEEIFNGLMRMIKVGDESFDHPDESEYLL